MTLNGKTVAITGSTGGLGRELCFKLAKLGVNLIMLNRNAQKTEVLADELIRKFNIKVTQITTELEDMESVKNATEKLIELGPDYFIANAGAYCIPRHKCSSGFENIFQINFVSPYYMISALAEKLPNIKFVAVGSIAHTYSVIDESDIDFSTRKGSAKPYGNSKRFLMLALGEKLKNTPKRLSIAHPGITFTNITAHYPKLIFAIIKHPMKIIFMKPKKAADCILEGVLGYTPFGYWIGPRFFGIWGKPRLQRLKAAYTQDSWRTIRIAEKIMDELK